VLGCSSATEPGHDTLRDSAAADPTAGWERATPAQAGLGEAQITALVQRIRTRPGGMRSLLIVRHGYLITEEYFNNSGPDVLHTLQSVSKSVTALAAGIAVTKGSLAVTDPVLARFPDYGNVQHLDEQKRALVVEDLLTMRTGLDWSESNYALSPLKQLNECACDWIRFVLDWPMRSNPGRDFEYNSGGVILLGEVTARASGAPFTTFIQQNLFAPLGITSVRWFMGAGGVPHTGGGLNMKAADLARLGLLVLHHGQWEGRQLIARAWLDRAVSVRTGTYAGWGNRSWSYGYLFWLTSLSGAAQPAGDDVVITGAGSLGQWLFVIPRHDLVIVMNGNSEAYDDFVAPVNYLFSDILPAVRD
jgi:CubicO group peptidase (beta-lactamase class C family)